MADLAQFDNDNPIIREQPIESKAQGLEAIAQTLGNISKEVVEGAKSMGEAQSSAMTLQTQMHADDIKTQAQVDLIKNPGLATQILENSKQQYQQVLQQAVVNKSDRSKLTYQANQDINALTIKAASVQNEVNNKNAAISIYTAFPDALKKLQDSVGDQTAFDNQLKLLTNTIDAGVRSGALPSAASGGFYKQIAAVVSSRRAYIENFGNPDIGAKEHNRMVQIPFANDDGHHGLPTDQNNAYHAQTYNSDTSAASVKSAIAAGGTPNPVAFQHIASGSQAEVLEYAKGASLINADMQTGVSYPEMEARFKELGKIQNPSPRERGEKDRLGNIINQGVNGNFLATISSDGNYQQMEAQHNQAMAAIMANPNLTDQQKMQQGQYESNRFAHSQVNLAYAKGMKDEYIQPIPKQIIDRAQTSFNKNADGSVSDPNTLKAVLKSYDPQLREYVARGLKTPQQQEVGRAVGNLLGSGVNDNDINMLIMSNQDGMKFTALEEGQRDEGKSQVRYKIAGSPAFKNATGYVGQQVNGTQRVAAMVDMTTNLAYTMAINANDLSNVANYAGPAANIVAKAYPVSSGSTWITNDHDLPNLSPQDKDIMSNYLINYVKENAKKLGYSDGQIGAWADVNNFKMLSTPTGNLVVADSYGNPLHTVKYSPSLLATAHADQERQDKERIKKSLDLRPFNPFTNEHVNFEPNVPKGITQEQIDKVNNLPDKIRPSHADEDTRNFHEALKPFMQDKGIDHKNMTSEQLEDELKSLKEGRGIKGSKS